MSETPANYEVEPKPRTPEQWHADLVELLRGAAADGVQFRVQPKRDGSIEITRTVRPRTQTFRVGA